MYYCLKENNETWFVLIDSYFWGPGSRKMEFKGNYWHETCFVCEHCRQPIGTKPLISKESGNYCVPCFEKEFAHYCSFCKKVNIYKAWSLWNLPNHCFLATLYICWYYHIIAIFAHSRWYWIPSSSKALPVTVRKPIYFYHHKMPPRTWI